MKLRIKLFSFLLSQLYYYEQPQKIFLLQKQANLIKIFLIIDAIKEKLI